MSKLENSWKLNLTSYPLFWDIFSLSHTQTYFLYSTSSGNHDNICLPLYRKPVHESHERIKLQSIIDNVILASLHTLHSRHKNKGSDTHPSICSLLQRLSHQTNLLILKCWECSNLCKNNKVNKVAWNAHIIQWQSVAVRDPDSKTYSQL